MTEKSLEKLLVRLGACSDGSAWAKGKTLKTAWETCTQAEWMCWLLVKMADKKGWPNKSLVRHVLCDCAETALKYTTDPRPKESIRIARLYADGKATDEQLIAVTVASTAAAWSASTAAAWSASTAAAWDAAGATTTTASRAAAGFAAGAAAWAATGFTSKAWATAAAAASAAAAAAAGATTPVPTPAPTGSETWIMARDAVLKDMADLIRKRIPKI